MFFSFFVGYVRVFKNNLISNIMSLCDAEKMFILHGVEVREIEKN